MIKSIILIWLTVVNSRGFISILWPVNRLLTGLNYTFLHDPKTIIRYLYRYILSICAIWKQYLRILPLYAQFVHICLFCLYWIFRLGKTVTLTLFIGWDIRRCHTHELFGFLAWNAILRELLIFPGLLYQEGTFYTVLHIFMLLNQLNRLIHLSITYCHINLLHVKAYD